MLLSLLYRSEIGPCLRLRAPFGGARKIEKHRIICYSMYGNTVHVKWYITENLTKGLRKMFQVVFILLALVAAAVHLALSSQSRSSGTAIGKTFLLHLLFFYVGLMGLLTAYAHVFRPIQTSASIGWSTSPYEYEVGMADLTVGVLGVLCVWIRGNFWLATAIANAVWLLGDAVGHIRQMVINNNHSANNAGIFLAAEIVAPVVILLLALCYANRVEQSG